MAHFPDLSPYAYGDGDHPGVVHVGWLDNTHPYKKGTVSPHLVGKMRELALNPCELYRGLHLCELCATPDIPHQLEGRHHPAWLEWRKPRSSNGEIRVTSHGITYAAPVLITHYIEAHGYLPPPEFLQAIEEINQVRIGWLDAVQPYSTGTIAPHLIEKIRHLLLDATDGASNTCPFCPKPEVLTLAGRATDEGMAWLKECFTGKEVRIRSEKVTYLISKLVLHYIEKHHYLPPPEFLKALEELSLENRTNIVTYGSFHSGLVWVKKWLGPSH